MKVYPIYGDNPGQCDVGRGDKACSEEAVVCAEVPIPGEDGTHVVVKFCRQDWAEVVEKEEPGPGKTVHTQPDANGNMTLGAYPPIPDND